MEVCTAPNIFSLWLFWGRKLHPLFAIVNTINNHQKFCTPSRVQEGCSYSQATDRNDQDRMNFLSLHQADFRWDIGCLGVKGFQHSFEGTGVACGVFSPNKRAKTLQVFWDQKQKKSSFELRKSLEKGLQTSSNKGNKKHLHWQLQLGVKKHKELWKTTSLSSSIASSTALHQLLCKQHSKGKQIIGTKCIKHGNVFRWHIL